MPEENDVPVFKFQQRSDVNRKNPPKTSSLLIDSNEKIGFQTQLAVVIGDRKAIALQQIHYWCDMNQRQGKREHFSNDHWWAYNTWREWHLNNFPFWSIPTIRRIFRDLEADGLIIVRQHEHRNKGLWATINYGRLEEMAVEKGKRVKTRRPERLNQEKSDENEPTGLINLIRGSDQSDQTLRDTETTTEKRDLTDSASEKIDAGAESRVKSKSKPRKVIERSAEFKVIADKSFGIQDVSDLDGRTVIRINLLVKWLREASPGATAETLLRFYEWWARTKRVSPPKDVTVFAENFTAFKQQHLASASHKPAEQSDLYRMRQQMLAEEEAARAAE